MEILTYLQGRKRLNGDWTEDQIRLILTVSGRSADWIGKISAIVKGNGVINEIGLVEQSGMGKSILDLIGEEEWVYLVNPSLAPKQTKIVEEGVVSEGKVFSEACRKWFLAQEKGSQLELSQQEWTVEEAAAVRCLHMKQETIVEREEIAQAVWEENWTSKYSDWALDALVHRLRRKLGPRWQITTIKGRGYILARSTKPKFKIADGNKKLITELPGSIYPSAEYLAYMNDPSKPRKVYSDLLAAIAQDKIKIPLRNEMTVICVNSYSIDNVDAIKDWVHSSKLQQVQVYWTHYDPRALEMHRNRIRELECEGWMETLYDDLRDSRLKENTIDILINDFRLNMNQDDRQNQRMMANTYRILAKDGVALISTVVDGRYESDKYGQDQEKAPINARNPGIFQADEHLVRRCWSVPYYRQLFVQAGFLSIKEYEVSEGRRWGKDSVNAGNEWEGPYYRRWRLRKS